ncbi:MAG: SGNH/GDSL hydrolase family protein [Cypionkella sp.]|uniref:SGNH/GDSL hydrolase family protein n=1 Tax=Cypionkella sp. TaxID=2811411 RepID=UPI002ABAA3A9|nr:SGNH/GDSL hydrolase family protein [Cypionkella sp.]MDZ4310133.1 SGNH/GDSL hydrolase family protein [Cypionkella sp.]
MPVVMCFGDSNTHGTPPITDLARYERYGVGVRWPSRVQAALGCEVIEEGLPGRTSMFDDPIMGAHMNGQVGLKIALESHGSLDVLVLMLGTNDVKARFTSTPEAVVGGIASLLDIAQHRLMQERHGGFKVLLVCPTPVVEVGPIKGEFWGGAVRSQALSPLYATLAQARGVAFLDAGEAIKVSPLDGVHFDQAEHAKLAEAVAGKLRGMI